MARRLRIQFPGAIYHVINRGNYRRDLFLSVGEAQAFLETLREARDLMGWHVHAYVLMRNHYHLAVETPEPNLVEGMHWLQSTWATRFNRFRQERGHLFQGRYQSLLIEDASALARGQSDGVRPLHVALTRCLSGPGLAAVARKLRILARSERISAGRPGNCPAPVLPRSSKLVFPSRAHRLAQSAPSRFGAFEFSAS